MKTEWHVQLMMHSGEWVDARYSKKPTVQKARESVNDNAQTNPGMQYRIVRREWVCTETVVSNEEPMDFQI